MAGALIVVIGLLSGFSAKDPLASVLVIFTYFVMAALLIAIAQIRDLAHATWKKVNRIEEELSNRSRRR